MVSFSSCPVAWGFRSSSNTRTAVSTCRLSVLRSALTRPFTAQWSPDLDNAANKAFVETFKAEYGRIPSLYASQAFDSANLIVSAAAKADVADTDAFRAALLEADFASTRGDFKFGNNQHPIQDFYVREVIKDGDVYTNKILELALEDRQDVYAADCKL